MKSWESRLGLNVVGRYKIKTFCGVFRVLLMTGRNESTCNCTCNSIGIDTYKICRPSHTTGRTHLVSDQSVLVCQHNGLSVFSGGGGGVASKTLSGSSNVTVKWTWAFWGGSPTTLCPQSRILNTEKLPGLFIPHALSKNVHHTTRPILAVDRNEELIGYVSVKRLPA